VVIDVREGHTKLLDIVLGVGIDSGDCASQFLVRFSEVIQHPFAIHVDYPGFRT
jgi:hypothetical protein